MKKSKNHSIYEVWSEVQAESIYFDHKPSFQEVFTGCIDNQWLGLLDSDETQISFVKSLLIIKLHPLYTK